MKRVLGLATVALLGVSIVGAGPAASAVAQAPKAALSASKPVIKVLPLGDAITNGIGSTNGGGYRSALWDRTEFSPTYEVDFVGGMSTGNFSDNAHEGHEGYKIDDIRNGKTPQEGVARWLPAFEPDVVLLQVGTNDLASGPVADRPTAPDRLLTLVDHIQTLRPNVPVIVAGLVPVTVGLENDVAEFNEKVKSASEERRLAGRKVRYTELPLVKSDMLDAVNPNDVGYGRIAEKFDAALTAVVAYGWVTGTPAPPSPKAQLDDSTIETSSRIRWADFDGDGKDDYWLIEDGGALHVWLNRGGDRHGGWVDAGVVFAGKTAEPRRVRLADYDGDGRDDYLYLRPNGGVEAVEASLNRGGDGHGGWQDLGMVATGTTNNAEEIRFADVDGDHKDDYLTVEEGGSVYVWHNDGISAWTAWNRWVWRTDTARGRVRFADIDGDGKDDYVRVLDGSPNDPVHVYLNRGGDGHGWWEDHGWIASGVTPDDNQVRFADLDGDKKDDYLEVTTKGRVNAWLNRGGDGRGGWSELRGVVRGAAS